MTTKATFWNLLTNYKISIPLIERDYALGRENEAYKRDLLLKKIYSHLTNNKSLHLDFVCGRAEGDTFTPIDGKQRLITLFLLHWYVSVKENINIDEKILLDRFVCNMRTNTRNFCEALVNKEITLPAPNNKEGLADTIRNKYWYKCAWNNHPNIQSMLVMIETIHQLFGNTERTSLWELLTQDEIITFELLEMAKKGYMQTDEPYLKAHTRGKQPTQFENFKTRFIQLIAQQHAHKKIEHPTKGEVTYATYMASKIEGEWTDLFWEFREDKTTIDDNFSDYFRYITRMLYLKDKKNSRAADFTNNFIQYEAVYGNKANLQFLIDSLNNLYELTVNQRRTDEESLNHFFNSLVHKVGANMTEMEMNTYSAK